MTGRFLGIVAVVVATTGCGRDLPEGPAPAAAADAASPSGDGAVSSTDAATPSGRAWFVFVSDHEYKPAFELEGRKGRDTADLQCQRSYESCVQRGACDGPRTFVAWLSKGAENTTQRLATGAFVTQAPLTVRRLFASKDAIVAGPPEGPIQFHADGNPVAKGTTVWTGTARNGSARSNCGDWTTTSAMGSVGTTDSAGGWTEMNSPEASCSEGHYLYCFEVPTPP